MEVLYPRCAGLDVHKETVVAGVRLVAGGKVVREVRTFETTTAGLLALAEWLAENGCTHVAMEATGVYWKPVWHVLAEGGFTLVLANAAHVKNVPGPQDRRRRCDLARRSAGARPDPRQLRAGRRRPRSCARCCARASSWCASRRATSSACRRRSRTPTSSWTRCVTDLIGMSGRAMLEALIAGETDPARLAALAHPPAQGDAGAAQRGAARAGDARTTASCCGCIWTRSTPLDAAIAQIDREVEAHLAPFRAAVELLTTIPGVGALAARVIVAEIGIDMGRFPTAGHLISWAGLCPRNDESAGKRRSTRLRKGAPWLKTTLVQCAWAAIRKKASYLQAQFHRLRARRGAEEGDRARSRPRS